MNRTGQGSGVFSLLIAAVVAMAILGVLLNILGIINVQNSQDAAITARKTLQDAYNNIGTPKISGKIQIKQNDIITNRGAAGDNFGISPDQVKVGFADSMETLFKASSGGASMTFQSRTTRDVRIVAVCDQADQLDSYLTVELKDWGISSTYIFDNGSYSSTPSETGCFVGVIPN